MANHTTCHSFRAMVTLQRHYRESLAILERQGLSNTAGYRLLAQLLSDI